VRDVEFIRDIRPLLQRSCVNCHSGDPASAPGSLSLDDTSMIAGVLPDTPVPSTPTDYARLARDRTARFGIKPPTGAHQNWVGANASRYVRIFQSRRSLLAWKLGGARTDGWDNSRWESTAPFTSDLARLLWDLDFNPGTVDHSTMLSNAEKRTVYAWIDLAAPVDLGGGYWRDENRPTLTVKVTNGVALVGAADAYSGLNESTVSLTVNGLFVALTKGSCRALRPGCTCSDVARRPSGIVDYGRTGRSPFHQRCTVPGAGHHSREATSDQSGQSMAREHTVPSTRCAPAP
jgi:hypothetical protein